MSALRSTSPAIATLPFPTARVTRADNGGDMGTGRAVSGSLSTPIGLPRLADALDLIWCQQDIQFRLILGDVQRPDLDNRGSAERGRRKWVRTRRRRSSVASPARPARPARSSVPAAGPV